MRFRLFLPEKKPGQREAASSTTNLSQVGKATDPWPRDEFRLDDGFAHLWIENQEKCRHLCERQECLYLCPSRVFTMGQGEKGEVVLAEYGRCLECGACQMFCPGGNIYLEYPRGGFGVIHKHG
ncbi:MAG: 4Fe-4S dicluster domain-containing protein [Firmicutes bacterium]|nr:4Fe-4S dicluster domain-containing protein [Bacillota bacterium]MCL5039359.1 4Fe-4S dicluster domain-containing protein [Bacillota bacterium]